MGIGTIFGRIHPRRPRSSVLGRVMALTRRSTTFPPEVRDLIVARAGGHYCEVGTEVCTYQAVEIQHRRARGMGGTRKPDTDSPANGLMVCRACHDVIERRPATSLRNGWRLRQTTDGRPTVPSEVAVVWRGRRVWLHDDGGLTPKRGVA